MGKAGATAVNLGQPKIIMTSNGPQLAYACGTLPKNAQLVQVNNGKITPVTGPMVSIVKQMGNLQLGDQCSIMMTQNPIGPPASSDQQQQQRSQTLPRQMPSSQPQTVRIVDSATLINASGQHNGQVPAGAVQLSREQLKLQLHKQFERQMQQQQQQHGKLGLVHNGDERSPSQPIAPDMFGANGTNKGAPPPPPPPPAAPNSASGNGSLDANNKMAAINTSNGTTTSTITEATNKDTVYYSMNV